jgi:hypothetical protein
MASISAKSRSNLSLHECYFNTRALAEALRGNTRIKRFQSRSNDGISDEDIRFLLWALSENLGIERLLL